MHNRSQQPNTVSSLLSYLQRFFSNTNPSSSSSITAVAASSASAAAVDVLLPETISAAAAVAPVYSTEFLVYAAHNGDVFGVQRYIALNERQYLAVGINARGTFNTTALIAAAQEGHADVVRVLLGVAGIDANAIDAMGYTALGYAILRNHRDVIALLLAFPGIDLTQRNFRGESAIDVALNTRNREIIDQINAAIAARAAMAASTTVVSSISTAAVAHVVVDEELGRIVNSINERIENMLAQNQRLLNRNIERERRLTDALFSPVPAAAASSARVSEQNFLLAAERGDLSTSTIMQYLDERSHEPAAMNIIDPATGNTALHLAAMNGHANVVADLLTFLGTNPMQRNFRGESAMDVARNREIIDQLDTYTRIYTHIYTREISIDALILGVEAHNAGARDAFRLAAAASSARVSEQNFLLAAERGDLLTITQYLVERSHEPAAINIIDPATGNTALHLAAMNGHANVVTELINRNGINIDLINRHGHTAAVEAQEHGHEAIAAQLTLLVSSREPEASSVAAAAASSATVAAAVKKQVPRSSGQPGNFQKRLADCEFEGEIPEELFCIFSQEIINDPVTITTTGLTYDRDQLKQYFANKGNPEELRCPVIGVMIKRSELSNATNISIKKMLESFVSTVENEKSNKQEPSIGAAAAAAASSDASVMTTEKEQEEQESLRKARIKMFDRPKEPADKSPSGSPRLDRKR